MSDTPTTPPDPPTPPESPTPVEPAAPPAPRVLSAEDGRRVHHLRVAGEAGMKGATAVAADVCEGAGVEFKTTAQLHAEAAARIRENNKPKAG